DGSLSGTYTFSTCNNGCSSAVIDNCHVPSRAHNQTGGTCAVGSQGSCSYSCQNGSNVLVHNTCGNTTCVNTDHANNMCAGRIFTITFFSDMTQCLSALSQCGSQGATRCFSKTAVGTHC